MADAAAVAHNATQAAQALPPAPLPLETTFSWGGYFQTIGVMLLLLAALWLVVWCLRKYGKFRFLPRPGSLPREALYLEAQLPMGPRRGLTVVRFMNKRLLLGVTENQITLLQEISMEKTTDDEDFSSVLDKETQRSAGH